MNMVARNFVNILMEEDILFSVLDFKTVVAKNEGKEYSVIFNKDKIIFNNDEEFYIPSDYKDLNYIFSAFVDYVKTGDKDIFKKITESTVSFICPICGEKHSANNERYPLCRVSDAGDIRGFVCKKCYDKNNIFEIYKKTGYIPMIWFSTNKANNLRIYEQTREQLSKIVIKKDDKEIRPIYDKKFSDALQDLSEALYKVVDLCFDDKYGDDFNNEILSTKLVDCWGMSIEEMAMAISLVAEEMEEVRKKV